MKEKLLLSLSIVMLLLISFSLEAQTVYMTDGFENGFNPTCDASCKTTAWTQEYYDASQKAWVTTAPKFSQAWKTETKTKTAGLVFPDGAAVGKGRAYFRNEPDKNGAVQTAGYKTRLVSPVMNLSQGYQPILRFYHAQEKYTGDFDTLRVYYRTGEQLQWNLLAEYTSPIKKWKFTELDLPAVGEYYQIAFEANENVGRGIVLDSVLVRTKPQITTPHDVTYSDMRDNGITVQWQASYDADEFQLVLLSNPDIDLNVKPDSISAALVDTTVSAFDGMQVRLDSLEGGKTYYVQIRSIGEAETSVWCDVQSFRMKPSVKIPFVEKFDEIKTTSNELPECQLSQWVWGGDNQPHIPMYLPTDLNQLYSVDNSHAAAFVKFGTYYSTTGFTAAATFIPAGTTALLVSPEIAPSQNSTNFSLNQCHVSFWGTVAQATDDHARSIIVGIMTDPEDITTFVPIDTCTVWGYKFFQFFDVNFASYQGEGRYVAFLSNFEKTNQFFIDDVTIEERPAVGTILSTDIKVLPDTESAIVSWNAVAGVSKYTVKVAKLETKGTATPLFADDIAEALSYSTPTPSLSLSELEPASKYVVSVLPEGGKWSQPRAFFTSAVMTISDTQEAFFAFDKDGSNYNIGEDLATLYPTDFMLFSNDPDIPYIYTTGYRTGSGCLGMTKNIGCDTWVVAPIVDKVDSLEVQFYAKTTGQGKLQVGVMTYPDDINTFVIVDEFIQETVYTKHYVNFLNYKGTGRYIAFRWVEIGDGATKSCNYIDDMTIRKLGNCLPVTGISITTTDSSAIVSWDKGSAAEWQLKVNSSVLADINIDNNGDICNINSLTSPTYTIDSLQWAKSYYVYVRAKCDETNFGDWVGKVFTTDCPERIPLPYKDDFDSYDATKTKLPPCWDVCYVASSSSTTYPKLYNTSTYANSGTNSIYLSSAATDGYYLSLPEVNAPLSDVRLRFYARGGSSTGSVLFVGVLDDKDDPLTFTRLDSIPMETAYTQYEVSLNRYTGTGKYIAFSSWRGTSNSVYLDDIEVVSAIDAAPANISIKAASDTSLTAVWEGRTTDKWDVIVSNTYHALADDKKQPYSPTNIPTAERVTEGQVATAEFVISGGLTAQTNYYFYVKSSAGTEWAVGTLATSCKGLNPREKYTEGFESVGKTVTYSLNSTTTAISYFKNAKTPTCWTVGNSKYGTDLSAATTASIRGNFPYVVTNGYTTTDATTNYYDKGTAKTTYAYAAAGYNSLKLNGSTTYGLPWAAMPYLECADEDIPMIIISGQLQMTSTHALLVGVMDDPEDLSTFVVVDSIIGGKGTGAGKAIAFEVSLENYTGKGHYIAFRTPYGKSATVYLDEVNVSLATCAAPNISFTKLTDTSVRVLSGLRIDNAWKYYLSTQPFDTKKMDEDEMPADSVVIDTKTVGDGSILVPYAPISGLLPDTTYYVAVATICEGTTSTWRQASFHTLCEDVAIESFGEDFEDYETGTDQSIGCWTVGNVFSGATSTYIPSVASTTFDDEKSKMLKLVGNKTYGNGAYAVMPGLSTPEGKSLKDYQLEMTVAATGVTGKYSYTASEEGTLIVGITDDPLDIVHMQVIDTFRFETAALNKLYVPFDNYTGSGKFVVLLSEAIEKTASWLFVDNITFSPVPSCKHAQKVQADSVEQTSVYLSWKGEADNYLVALAPEAYPDSVKNDTLTSANKEVLFYEVEGTSVHISGLKPNTNYYASVQAVCSETDKSIWSTEKVWFRTECPDRAAIPWFDDFDDEAYATGSGNFGYCYQGEYLLNGAKSSAYPQITSGTSSAFSGEKAMKMYATAATATTVLATPELDVDSLSELQLSFYAKGAANKWLYIGTVDSVDAMANTFVPFDSVLLTASYERYMINLDTVQLGARADKKHIAFCVTKTAVTLYIDNLYIRYIPTCYEPKEVTVSDIDYTTATLHFVPFNESDSSWVVSLKNVTDNTADTFTISTPSYQLTTLKPSTDYSLSIHTDCGEDQSEWSEEVAFHTKWIIDSTYTFTFKKDEQHTISCNTPLSSTAYIHPALTSLTGAGNTAAYYPQYVANSATTYAYAYDPEGNTEANALKFQTMQKYDSATLVLPLIREPQDKQLRFTLRAGYAYISDHNTKTSRGVVCTVYPRAVLTLGTVDSTCSMASFQPYTTISPSRLVKSDTLSAKSNYGWDEMVLPLAPLPLSDGRQVAFRMVGCLSSTLYMGGLAIEKAEGFTTPVITATEPADTTITLSWLGDPASTYTVYVIDTLQSSKSGLNFIPYLQDAAPECIKTFTNVKGTSYTISGLEESSTYAVYVQLQDTSLAKDAAALSKRTIVNTVCSQQNGNGYSYSFEVGAGYKSGKNPSTSVPDGFVYQWPTSTTAGDSVYRTPSCWTIGMDIDNYDPASTTYKSYNPTMIPNKAKSERYALSGNSALQFYGNFSSSYSYKNGYAIMPSLAFDTDTAELVFYGRCFHEKVNSDGTGTVGSVIYIKGGSTTAYSQQIAVGTVLDPQDISTFVPLDTVEYTYSTDELSTQTTVDYDPAGLRYFQKFAIPLKGAKGKFITFMQVGYGKMWIDDISIQKRQTPRVPRNLDILTVSTDSVVLTWKAMETGNTFTIQYMEKTSTWNWTKATTIHATGNTCVVKGLQPATQYIWRVCQTGSEFGDSEYSTAEAFATDCELYSPNGFSTGFEGSAADPDVVFYKSGTTEYKNNKCWTYLNQGTSTAMGGSWAYNIPAANTYSYAHNGKAALKLYHTSTTYQTVAVTPELDAAIGKPGEGFDTLQVSFWMCPTAHYTSGTNKGKTYTASGKTYSKRVDVGTCTDPNDPATYTVLDSCFYECDGNNLAVGTQADADNNYAFQQFTVKLDKATGPYVFFRANKNRTLADGTGCTSSTVYIDDVQFETLNRCEKPLNDEVSDITIHNAKLSWDKDDFAAFDVEVATNPTFDSTALVFSKYLATDSVVTITGLSKATQYYYHIRSYCDDAHKEYSDWTQTAYFRTPFAPVFNEDFTTNDLTSTQKGWSMMTGYAKDIFAGTAELTANTFSSDYNSWYRLENNVMSGMHLRLTLFYAGSAGKPTATYQTETYRQKYWLITPLISIEKDSTQLVFDASLSTYEYLSKTLNQPITVNPEWNTGWDDQFMIIISEDGGQTWKKENAIIWNNETSNDANDAHYRYGIGDYRLTDMAYEPHKVAIDLSKYAGKTIKIAFYGENIEQNANCAIHIDNIHVNRVIKQSEKITTCQYEDVEDELGFSWDGDTISAGEHHFEKYALAYDEGKLDSVFILDATVKEAPVYNYAITVCEGTPFEYLGFNEHSVPGTYRMKLTSQVTGCDSIVNFTISHTPKFETVIDTTICEGSFIDFGGKRISEAGIYTDSLQACETLGGCDSIVTLHVSVTSLKRSRTEVTLCQGESYQFGDKIYSATGIYNDTISTSSCDSIATLALTIRTNAHTTVTDSIMHGETYLWAGKQLQESATVDSIFTDSYGCDSIVTLNLLVKYADVQYEYKDICQGSTYTFGNKTYSMSGTYYDTVRVAGQADVIKGLVLTVHAPEVTNASVTLCAGDSLVFGGQVLKEAGVYSFTYENRFGCDSVVNLQVAIQEVVQRQVSAQICEGAAYDFNGKLLAESGTYYDTLRSVLGCDSVITKLVLDVVPTVHTKLNVAICYGGEYLLGDTVLTTAGDYVRTTINATTGCDEITTLHLSVNEPLRGTMYASFSKGCGYTYNGKTYNQPGQYEAGTLKTVNGCDSIITLILTESDQGRDTVWAEVCPGEYYIDTDFNTNVPGIHEIEIVQSTGCTIIRTLVLSNKDNHINKQASICLGDSYDFYGRTLTEAGDYTETFAGQGTDCDTIVTLTLSVFTGDTLHIADEITTDQLPYEYAGEEVLPLGTTEGFHVDTIEVKSETGNCTQVVILTITVRQTDALDNVKYATLQIRPNVIQRGETVRIENDFSASDRAEMTLNMFDMLGHRIELNIPEEGAITLSDFPSAGVYVVRLSTSEQIYIGRIVVKN